MIEKINLRNMDKLTLKRITKEIEEKYDCKVISIRYVQLLSLCVTATMQFNKDFLYKPFDKMPKPNYISFSERNISITKRVDLFECVKNFTNLNLN